MTEIEHSETQRAYVVAGMTCDRCVLSVTEEVSAIAGVARVGIDLASGHMVVHGEGFADDAIADAIAAAGYEVAP